MRKIQRRLAKITDGQFQFDHQKETALLDEIISNFDITIDIKSLGDELFVKKVDPTASQLRQLALEVRHFIFETLLAARETKQQVRLN